MSVPLQTTTNNNPCVGLQRLNRYDKNLKKRFSKDLDLMILHNSLASIEEESRKKKKVNIASKSYNRARIGENIVAPELGNVIKSPLKSCSEPLNTALLELYADDEDDNR